MNIYIRYSPETQDYLPLVVKALQKAKHQVILRTEVKSDMIGKDSSDLCLNISLGGRLLREQHSTLPSITVYNNVDLRIQKIVLAIGRSVIPRRQIVADLNLRQNSRAVFINNYLKPAVAAGFVTKANTRIPSAPNQAYRLTANGLDLYTKLTNENNL